MNNDLFVNDLTKFAMKFGVSLNDAYVLPALFEFSAQKIGMGVMEFVDEALNKNRPLGEYMAEKAKEVADLDRKEA